MRSFAIKIGSFDSLLAYSFIVLLLIGIVMVASASMPVTEKYHLSAFHFCCNHVLSIGFGLIALFITSCVPIKYIERYSIVFLLINFIFLSLVLIPGISRPVNGALRWIFLGPISIQPSEFTKLAVIIYIAGYLVRRNYNFHHNLSGFMIPLLVLTVFDVLLLLEPDFGALIVVSITVLGMLFVAGMRLSYLMVLTPLAVTAVVTLSFIADYRWQRILSFLNPWVDQFDKGYQLVQSLIAFGRGSLFGTGLGCSVQKLFYLPETYTDFIFAILAEELGLIGACIVIGLFALLLYRILHIAKKAYLGNRYFAAYLAYGIALWIALQTIINIGVNVGLLPTKGLTLPLLSFGGNSLLVICIALGLVFRIDYENKIAANKRHLAT